MQTTLLHNMLVVLVIYLTSSLVSAAPAKREIPGLLDHAIRDPVAENAGVVVSRTKRVPETVKGREAEVDKWLHKLYSQFVHQMHEGVPEGGNTVEPVDIPAAKKRSEHSSAAVKSSAVVADVATNEVSVKREIPTSLDKK